MIFNNSSIAHNTIILILIIILYFYLYLYLYLSIIKSTVGTLLSPCCQKALFSEVDKGGYPLAFLQDHNLEHAQDNYDTEYQLESPHPVRVRLRDRYCPLLVQCGLAYSSNFKHIENTATGINRIANAVADADEDMAMGMLSCVSHEEQLQQKQQSTDIGATLASNLLTDINQFWAELAKEAIGGEAYPVEVTDSADLHLAHSLLGFSDLIHTLGTDSFLSELLVGVQRQVDASSSSPSSSPSFASSSSTSTSTPTDAFNVPINVSNKVAANNVFSSSDGAHKQTHNSVPLSLLKVVVQKLLVPSEAMLSVCIENAGVAHVDVYGTSGTSSSDGSNSIGGQIRRKMEFRYSSCKTRQAALYFLGAHFALEEPIPQAPYALRVLFAELDTIGLLEDVNERARGTKRFIKVRTNERTNIRIYKY